MGEYDHIARQIEDQFSVKREDIARAKCWIMSANDGPATHLVGVWFEAQQIEPPNQVNPESPSIGDDLLPIARSFELRGAFYRACFELAAAGDILLSGPIGEWRPSLLCTTPRLKTNPTFHRLKLHEPGIVCHLNDLDGFSRDIDVFLEGVSTESLHEGIKLAIEESLRTFRKGLYMPAIAMLAAAAEATWTECGSGIAKNKGDQPLQKAIDDQSGIAKLVSMIVKIISGPNGKDLLENSGVSIHEVNEAHRWTDELREKRNALHWGKKKSFIAEHSDAATLLMGAPRHIRTIERIRSNC